MKSRTARIFWENGFKTVGAVAGVDSKDLLPVLLLVSFDFPSLPLSLFSCVGGVC